MSNIDTTALKDDDVVEVRNFIKSKVTIHPSPDIRREFNPGATMKVRVGELRDLFGQRGGSVLLHDYLHVGNEALAKEFGVTDDEWENEYSWDISDIKDCLTADSTDALEDALDYAPQGIKDTIVEEAVEMEVPDVRKREVIKKQTGYDVSKKIENKHLVETETKASTESKPVRRRVTNTTNSGRRVQK